jgi:two-component system LytT family response regulator
MKMMTKKIRTLIVDDEELARSRLRRLLESEDDIVLESDCKNGLEALNRLNSAQIDLLFLDIQMPELNGFEVLNHLDQRNIPIVIFVTAYDKYALKAFEFHALDYLLKPFDDERFYTALNHARKLISDSGEDLLSQKISNLINDFRVKDNSSTEYIERIVIKSRGRIYFLKTNDIVRIKAAGKYLEISDGKKLHLLRQTMSEIEIKLNPKIFVRIHRSVIVNVNFIKEIQHWYKNEYNFKLNNGENFKSSGGYRRNLDHLLI